MKRLLFTMLLPLAFSLAGYGQVATTFFPKKDALQRNSYTKNHRKTTKTKKMPLFNIQRMMGEDKLNEKLEIPLRFGKGFDVNLTLADGEWTTVENGRLWSMNFQSQGAYSINFIFNHFYLPDGAELHIANLEGTMLYGPVTSKQNTKSGCFLTDLIPGDDVTIYLFEPTDKEGQSRLSISKVVHAYKNLVTTMTNGNLGGSGSCNNNITCFSSFDLESDAVALVLLSSGVEWCTGALLMTANQNFRPYFLSAFHCIDTSGDRNLSSTEISNAQNWMFKFQYKTTTCAGGVSTTSISYNGSEFRAAWDRTDFALMELNNSPVGDDRFSWLGWDRGGSTPTSGTGIHHPSGDVMKVSFEENQFQTSDWNGENNHWLISFNNGVVEHGSSGSPIFDQNKRVVGQLHGNQRYNQNLSYCEQSRAEYGRFDVSWAGGGTNATRLSNWLDPTNSNVITTNTSRAPKISGPDQICDQATYTINNLPQGATIVWRTSFLLSVISGQGTSQVTISKNSLISFFNNTIYADVTIDGHTFTVQKTGILLGTQSPSIVVYDSNGIYRVERCYTGITYQITANKAGSAYEPKNNFLWTIPVGSGRYISDNGHSTSFAASAPGYYEFRLRYYNSSECGWTDREESRTIYFEQGGQQFSVYPNPASDAFTVDLKSNVIENNVTMFSQLTSKETEAATPYTIQLWNEQQGLVRTIESTESRQQVSLQGLPSGTYYVVLIKDGVTVGSQTLLKK